MKASGRVLDTKAYGLCDLWDQYEATGGGPFGEMMPACNIVLDCEKKTSFPLEKD